MRDDLQNLNYGVLKAALKPDITAKLVEKGTITKEQGEVRDEIYNTFDTVFKPEIINKLNEYQIRAVDKQENIDAEIDEKQNVCVYDVNRLPAHAPPSLSLRNL